MNVVRARLAAPLAAEGRWCFEEFELDVHAGRLTRGGIEVKLRRQVWQLLRLFAANPGRLLRKAELFEALWPRAVVVDDALVQCVVELRKALADRDRRLVATVARLGYRFDATVQRCRCEHSVAVAQSSADGRLSGAWAMLVQADDAAMVGRAGQLFEAAVGEADLRAEALAGVAMSHVIAVLNRWAQRPAWNVAIAREAADESMELDPGSARACHACAHVALIEGQHVEAYLGFRAALRRNPAMARARLRLGVIEMELGHPERTGEWVRQALETGRGDEALQAQAFFIHGMALFHLGRDAEAATCMSRVLLLRPANGLAHQWLAAIDALYRRARSSAIHLESFCKHVPGHTLDSLRSTERSHEPAFMQPRRRFYDGLRRAGLR